MSLISQNAPSKKDKRRKVDEGADFEESPGFLGVEEADVTKVSNSTKLRRKKKKKNRDVDVSRREDEPGTDAAEEKNLEDLLFGSLYSFPEFGKEGNGDGEVIDATSGPQFYIDKSGSNSIIPFESEFKVQDHEQGQVIEFRESVWVDDEEEKLRVDVTKVNRLRKLRQKADETVISGSDFVSRLRAQHIKLNPATDWARIGSTADDYNSSDDEESDQIKGTGILQSTDDLIVKDSSRLLPGILEYSRLMDANQEESSNGPINSVHFHRNAQLLLTAGLDRRLRFFQVDGKHNTRVESVFLEDCPIRKASFLPDGSQAIISGRRKFFYCFDLVKARIDKVGPLLGREEKSLESFEVSPDSSTIAFIGNEGYILLVSSKTKNLVGTLKMNGSVRSLAFTDDGRQLLSGGGDGHVYHWDLRTMRCFHKGVDEGCLTGSALCTSPGNALFAAGSSSGIVNVYSSGEFLGGKKRPLKTIENLTTKIDCLKFSPDAQILAICSSMKKNSLKLVHAPSFTVFSNWPALGCNLGYPRCLDFSPNGGFMAVGNAAGKVLLYKLRHYQKA
ncbi:transducin/WD40 repeat-like superfamily protein [Wolffia australiana]